MVSELSVHALRLGSVARQGGKDALVEEATQLMATGKEIERGEPHPFYNLGI